MWALGLTLPLPDGSDHICRVLRGHEIPLCYISILGAGTRRQIVRVQKTEADDLMGFVSRLQSGLRTWHLSSSIQVLLTLRLFPPKHPIQPMKRIPHVIYSRAFFPPTVQKRQKQRGATRPKLDTAGCSAQYFNNYMEFHNLVLKDLFFIFVKMFSNFPFRFEIPIIFPIWILIALL